MAVALGVSQGVLGISAAVYREDFNTGATLSELGFSGPSPSYLILDTRDHCLRSCSSGDMSGLAEIGSTGFQANRNKGAVTVEWKVRFLSERPGQAWMENNKLWVSLACAQGKPLYSLLFKPHAKQDQWKEPDGDQSSRTYAFETFADRQ